MPSKDGKAALSDVSTAVEEGTGASGSTSICRVSFFGDALSDNSTAGEEGTRASGSMSIRRRSSLGAHRSASSRNLKVLKSSSSRSLSQLHSVESAAAISELYPMAQDGILSRRTKFMFTLPAVGWYAVKYQKTSFMKQFYTDDYPRVSLGYIAFFSVLAVLIDAFTDPAMALWTDTYKSKHGRRRPFIFASGFFTLVVATLAFAPPAGLSSPALTVSGSVDQSVDPGLCSANATLIDLTTKGLVQAGTAKGYSCNPAVSASLWYGVFHILYKLCDTLGMIPYEAFGPEMTPNYKQRNILYTWQELMLILGILLGSVLPGLVKFGPDCSSTAEDGCMSYWVLAMVFGLMHLGAMLWLAICSKERPTESVDIANPTIVPTLVSCFLNRPFRILIVSDIIEAMSSELPFIVLPYITKWVIGTKTLSSGLLFSALAGLNLITRMCSVPVWLWIANRYDKFVAYFAFNIALFVSHTLLVFISFDKIALIAVLIFFWGAVYGGRFLLKAIMCDVIDYDEFLTGSRREGQYLMFLEFVPKFMQIPSQALPFVALAYAGYDPSLPSAVENSQSAGVIWTLKLCISLIPAGFIGIGAYVLKDFPMRSEEDHHKLLEGLQEHKLGKPAFDPYYKTEVAPPQFYDIEENIDQLLSHFFPNEILEGFQKKDLQVLQRKPMIWIAGSLVGCIPSVWLLVVGWKDMSSKLGASMSPVGMMFLGCFIVIIWFNTVRMLAGRKLVERKVPMEDLSKKLKQMARFTGVDLTDTK